MKVFEYMIIYNPDPEKGDARIIVPVKIILAVDQQKATMLASRDIPEDFLTRINDVEVVVRPF